MAPASPTTTTTTVLPRSVVVSPSDRFRFAAGFLLPQKTAYLGLTTTSSFCVSSRAALPIASVARILDVMGQRLEDVANVSGLKVHGAGAASGGEYSHAPLSADVVLPFV